MTEKPLIVALVGEANAGRTTLAKALQAQGFTRIAFDDVARAEVAAAWRIDVRMLSDATTMAWPIPALAVGQCSDTGFMRWAVHGGESLTEARSAAWVLGEWAAYRQRTMPSYFAAIVERSIGRLVGCSWRRIVIDEVASQQAVADMLRRVGAKVLRVHRPELASAAQAGQVVPQRHVIAADADVVNDGSLQALAEAGAEAVEALA